MDPFLIRVYPRKSAANEIWRSTTSSLSAAVTMEVKKNQPQIYADKRGSEKDSVKPSHSDDLTGLLYPFVLL